MSVSWRKIDRNKGYAVGTLNVLNGAVPLIVKNFRLAPMDVIMFGQEIAFPNWRGVVTQAKLDPARTKVLNEAMAKVVAHEDWKKYCAVKFSCIDPSTPEEASAFVKQQYADLAKFMKQFGITKK